MPAHTFHGVVRLLVRRMLFSRGCIAFHVFVDRVISLDDKQTGISRNFNKILRCIRSLANFGVDKHLSDGSLILGKITTVIANRATWT